MALDLQSRPAALTAQPAEQVKAPLIAECHANFECKLADDTPETLHYTGDGVFMVSGKIISRRSQFRSGML